MRSLQITPDLFYKVGFGCFTVISICSFFNLALNWAILNIFSKISSMASLIFNLALVGFFYYLIKTQSIAQTSVMPGLSEEDIQNAFEEAKEGLKGK